MKKRLVFLLSLSTLFLVSCDSLFGDEPLTIRDLLGEDTEDVTAEEDTNQPSDDTTDDDTTAEDSNIIAINQPIVDDDVLTMELVEAELVNHEHFEEYYYEIRFEVKNNSDVTVILDASELSINDRMVDPVSYTMFQEISSGKSAETILYIQDFGNELPPLENNIELKIKVYDWDFTVDEEYPVRADLN